MKNPLPITLTLLLLLLTPPIWQPPQSPTSLANPNYFPVAPNPDNPQSSSTAPSPSPSAPSPAPPAPVNGTRNVLAILIDFPDKAGTKNQTYYNNLLFSNTAGSLKRYYEEASYNKFTINGTTLGTGWYRSSKNMTWWGEDKTSKHDDYNGEIYNLAGEAISLADANVSFKTYDRNGDNTIQTSELSIWIIHAGQGQESTSTTPDNIWSHSYTIPGGIVKDGIRIYNYTMQAEHSPIGTFSHEFGHDLGLPDLYDTEGSKEYLGRWDLMARGSWNSGGDSPAHPTSWSKIRLGWLNSTRITTVATQQVINLTINPLETSDANVTRITTGSTYYLIEVRQKTLYDSALPDYGVLILYCDDSLGSGKGIVKAVNSRPSDSSLDHAPFNIGAGENSTFKDAAKGITITILEQLGTSFKIQVNYQASNIRITATTPNIRIIVDGINYTAPTVFTWAAGTTHTISVPDTQGNESVKHLFLSWSDGGSRTHTITASSSDTTVTATYRTQYLLTITSPHGTTSGSGWYDNGTTAHAELNIGVIGGADGSRLRFADWGGDASGASFSASNPIIMDRAKSVTANWKTQYATALIFKTWDGSTLLYPSQYQISGASPNSTQIIVTAFSNIWLDNVQWTLTQVLWQGSNIAPNTTISYTPTPLGTWIISCSVYKVDFTNAFKDSDGAELSTQPSSFSLLAANNSNTGPLSLGTYMLQQGAFKLRFVSWEGFEVPPASGEAFNPAAGNPRINCAISDLTITVKDALGLAVSGVKVSIIHISSGATLATATTDSDGKTIFPQLPNGNYRAEIASLSPMSIPLTLSGDKAAQATALLSYPVIGVFSAIAISAVILLLIRRRRLS